MSLASPIAGEIVQVNAGLDPAPEIINQDPYEKGWLAVIQPSDWQADRRKLLDAAAYLAAMRSQAEEELMR